MIRTSEFEFSSLDRECRFVSFLADSHFGAISQGVGRLVVVASLTELLSRQLDRVGCLGLGLLHRSEYFLRFRLTQRSIDEAQKLGRRASGRNDSQALISTASVVRHQPAEAAGDLAGEAFGHCAGYLIWNLHPFGHLCFLSDLLQLFDPDRLFF